MKFRNLIPLLCMALLFAAPAWAEHGIGIHKADGSEVPSIEAFGPLRFGAEHIFSVEVTGLDINAGRPSLSMIPGRDGDPDGFTNCTLIEDGGDPTTVTASCSGVNWPDLFTGAGYLSTVTISQAEPGAVASFAVVVAGDF